MGFLISQRHISVILNLAFQFIISLLNRGNINTLVRSSEDLPKLLDLVPKQHPAFVCLQLGNGRVGGFVLKTCSSFPCLSLCILPYLTFTGVQGSISLLFSKVCWVAKTQQIHWQVLRSLFPDGNLCKCSCRPRIIYGKIKYTWKKTKLKSVLRARRRKKGLNLFEILEPEKSQGSVVSQEGFMSLVPTEQPGRVRRSSRLQPPLTAAAWRLLHKPELVLCN